MAQAGKKYDENKPMWHLLPWEVIEEVVKVLTFGANTYGENDWQAFVSRDKNEMRYFSAAVRHLCQWKKGKIFDDETKYHHLCHAICCLFFIVWKDYNIYKRRVKNEK